MGRKVRSARPAPTYLGGLAGLIEDEGESRVQAFADRGKRGRPNGPSLPQLFTGSSFRNLGKRRCGLLQMKYYVTNYPSRRLCSFWPQQSSVRPDYPRSIAPIESPPVFRVKLMAPDDDP